MNRKGWLCERIFDVLADWGVLRTCILRGDSGEWHMKKFIVAFMIGWLTGFMLDMCGVLSW